MSLAFEFDAQSPEALARCAQVRAHVEAFCACFDLTPYLFTRLIRIKPRVIPHSHPVLTLNTFDADDPDAVLATFLHEQIHWHCTAKSDAVFAAMEVLRERYPALPRTLESGGADGEESSYLHLIVNFLELEAVSRYLGPAKAAAVGHDHYAAIYAVVRRDAEAMGALIRQFALQISE